MKKFDFDWNTVVVCHLREWRRLSVASRTSLLSLFENSYRSSEPAFRLPSGSLDELLEKKYIVLVKGGKKIKRHKDKIKFLKALSIFGKQNIFGYENRAPGISDYISYVLLKSEKSDIFWKWRAYSGNKNYKPLESFISRREWLEPFLNSDSLEEMVAGLKYDTEDFPGKSFLLIKKMIDYLLSHPEPVTLDELADRFSKDRHDDFSRALTAGVKYLVFFPGLSADAIPVLGVHPKIIFRLHRKLPEKPAFVEPVETITRSFLLDDMTAILLECSSNKLRIKTNGRFYAKAERTLEEVFVDLPDWVVHAKGKFDKKNRIETALDALNGLELSEKKAGCLTLKRSGAAWLKKTKKERLKGLLDKIFVNMGKNRKTPKTYSAYSGLPSMLPRHIFYESEFPGFLKNIDFQKAFADAFATADHHVFMESFLTYAAICKNPFYHLPDDEISIPLYYSIYQHSELTNKCETIWKGFCIYILKEVLMPLGAVDLCSSDDGELCFRLNDIGEYLLGIKEDFDLPGEYETHILVQPNFEITFLTPSPGAEETVLQFSERRGGGVGVIGKITKKSIHNALNMGLTSDDVLEALERLSKNNTPKNVTIQIKTWFEQCAFVNVREIVIIECPSAETAKIVEQITRKMDIFRQALTPEIIAICYINQGEKNKLMKRLNRESIFLK